MKSVWRILLVEDNDADALLIEEAMRQRSIDCQIDHFLSAPAAIEAVKLAGSGSRPVPDLILLDYNLPGGQGSDILAAALGNPHLHGVPKAVISSCLRPDELRQITELGAACLILKPCGLDEFFSEVGTRLEELLRIPGRQGAVAT